jgi:hypothetical protein
MTTILRKVLYGAVALVVLCFASPATVQADHGRGWGDRWEWREHAYRPHYYYPRTYGYYEPGYGYYYYPRYGRYYGVPRYGYYRYPWGGGAVHAGPVHVWW